MVKQLHKATQIIKITLEWLAAMSLFAMMTLTFVDVVGRYVFSAPIFGSAEITQFMLATLVFAALGPVSMTNGHIAVELFDAPLDKIFPRSRRIIIHLFSAAGLLLMTYQLGVMAIQAAATERHTIVMEWPLISILAPSAFFCLVAAILQILYLARGPGD